MGTENPATRDRKTRGGDELAEAPTVVPALRYVGNGTTLPDVPARDIQIDEIEQYDRTALIASGLYEA